MKKQIILLMTDTTRKDMVGCYGNKKMITPNLDAFTRRFHVTRHIQYSSRTKVRREVQFLQVHFLIQMAWLRMGFHWGQM